jgi:hypothetical protein
MDLVKNRRAINDPDHVVRIEKMVYYSTRYPVTLELVDYLKQKTLIQADVSNMGSRWLRQSTCLTSSNVERAQLNASRAH